MKAGSVSFSTALDNSQLERDLAGLKKKIAKIEQDIAGYSQKRNEALKKSLDLSGPLDAEKKKLQGLRDHLADLRARAGDKSLSASARAESKSFIPAIQQEVAEQREYVRGLQTEWNKAANAADQYGQKLKAAEEALDRQEEEAGFILKKINELEQRRTDAVKNAEVANQHIVDLNSELLRLKQRQEELGESGIGLGYKEYDENSRKIAGITAELKKYQAELQNTAELQRFQAAVAQLKSSLAGLYDAAAPAFGKMADAVENIASEFSSALGEAFKLVGGRIAESIDFKEIENSFIRVGKRISESMQPLINKIADSDIFRGLKEKFSSAADFISKTAQSISEKIGPEISTSVKLTVGILKEIPKVAGQIAGKLGEVVSAVSEVVSASAAVVKPIASAVWNVLKTVGDVVGNAVVNLSKGFMEAFSAAKKFASTAVKAFEKFAVSAAHAVQKLNPIPKLIDAVSSKIKRLGQMIRRVFVFSVITSGLREMRSLISSYLGLNEQLSTSLRRLQGVLLTAFQPIYEVIVPALNTLINVLSRAIAAVSQFFASLFGTTAKRAQENAKALYNQAHALKETGKAADEAAGSLAAFDEINTIETEKNSGGGGGGDEDLGPLFDWEYDDTEFDSWGEAFSAFLDKLLAGIPKLEEAFKKFADWLNDFSQKLYDMFTFPGVLEKVERLGRELAGAFEKLLDWIDWNLLGKALGAGLNLALQFLTEFLYAFPWMKLGRKLADFINGLVSEIDWYDFGRLLWAGFKIALETLAGFILGLDMPLIAQAASNVIKGFFDEMKNTIEKIPWWEIGAQLARFLNNIDWYGCIVSVLAAIAAALNALRDLIVGFVSTMDWSGIAKQIYTAINDSLGQVDWRGLGQALGDLFIHVFEFLRDIIGGINWAQIGTDIASFIVGIDWNGVFSSVLTTIANALNALRDLIIGFVSTMDWSGIAVQIYTAINDSFQQVDWRGLGEALGDLFVHIFDFLQEIIAGIDWFQIGRDIAELMNGIDWSEVADAIAKALKEAFHAAVELLSGFISEAEPDSVIAAVALFFGAIFGPKILKHLEKDIAKLAKSLVSTLLTAIQTALAPLVGKIAELIGSVFGPGSVFSKIALVVTGAVTAISSFFNIVIDGFTWAKEAAMLFGIAIAAVGAALLGVPATVAAAVAGVVAAVASVAAVILSHIDGVKEAFASLKEKFTEFGGNIVEGLINGIKSAWDGLLKLIGSLLKGFLDAFLSFLGIHSPSTVFAEIGENIIAGLLQGIKDKWHGIIEFLTEKVEGIKELFSKAWDGIKEAAASAWDGIKTFLGDTWDSIKETAGTAFDAIKETVGKAWESIREATGTIWEGIQSTLSAVWETLSTVAGTAFESIRDAVSAAWDAVQKKTGEIWDGDGVFIAFAATSNSNQSRRAARSTDNGKTWVEIKIPSSTKWAPIAYGDGVFITAESDGNRVAYSTDRGENWITSTTSILPYNSNGYRAMAYGDGVFVIATYLNTIAAYSTDNGKTWTTSTLPYNSNWSSAAYGNGVFVIVASSGRDKAVYSTDNGKTWVVSPIPTAEWQSVAYGNGVFVTVSTSSNKAAYSPG